MVHDRKVKKIKKANYAFLIASAALMVLGYGFHSRADFNLKDWESKSVLGGSSIKAADFVLLDISSEFFSRLKSDLSDLRIVNGDGEVPYVLAIQKDSESYATVPAGMSDLSTLKGLNTSFILDVGAGGTIHNFLSIVTSSKNFRRMVTIEGSNDRNSWRTLTDKGQIFDYTVKDIKSLMVKDTSISYPDSTLRYLRVTIWNRGEAPLAVSGTAVSKYARTAAKEILYSPTMESWTDAADKTTSVILDMGAKGIPHRKVKLETDNVNFSRPLQIFESDDKASWNFLGNFYIFSIATNKFTGSNLEFSYHESNKRYLKLLIMNRDDKPITINNATVTGDARQILFYFDPAKVYAAYLDNPNAKRPEYDLQSFSQYVNASALSRVAAGPIENNPDFVKPPARPLSLGERSPYILPSILTLAVVILGYLLYRLYRKSDLPS